MQVVNNVSFDIQKGEVFGLLGPNGAGKTTIIKMISTLAKIDSGTVMVDGKNIEQTRNNARNLISVVPQDINLDENLTVYENLKIYAGYRRIKKPHDIIINVIQQFGLTDKTYEPIDKLSGGLKRRVMIARVMIGDPQLILMDEPTIGLDPAIRREIWNIIIRIKAAGKSILLTTHYTDEAELLCDRVAIMSKGEITSIDTPKQLIKQAGKYVVEYNTDNGDKEYEIINDKQHLEKFTASMSPESYSVRGTRLEDVVIYEGKQNEQHH